MKRAKRILLPLLLFISSVARADECTPPFTLITDLILRGDYERSVDRLLNLEFHCSDSKTKLGSVLLQARLYELSGKRPTAVRLLERFSLRNGTQIDNKDPRVLNEQLRLYVSDANFSPALNLAQGTPKNQKIHKLSQEYLELQRSIPSPSTYAAASVIPGLGQILMGEHLSAASSVFMIAIPTFFAIQARNRGEKAFEIASWTLSGFFYLGNISAAYRSSELKNIKEVSKKWKQTVSETFQSGSSSAALEGGFPREVIEHLYPKTSL